MYGNKTPSGLLSHNSEWPRIFRFTGANQNVPKLIFTDLVNTNTGYCVRRDSNRKVLPPFNPAPPPPPLHRYRQIHHRPHPDTDRLTCNNRPPNGTYWSTHPFFTFHLSVYFRCFFILYEPIIISPICNGKEVFFILLYAITGGIAVTSIDLEFFPKSMLSVLTGYFEVT